MNQEKQLFSMKETCKKTGLSYDTLKYYCNEGLIPHVKRDKNNYRVFDENNRVCFFSGWGCAYTAPPPPAAPGMARQN